MQKFFQTVAFTFLINIILHNNLRAAVSASSADESASSRRCKFYRCPQQGDTNLCFLMPYGTRETCLSDSGQLYTSIGSPAAFFEGAKEWQLAMRRLLTRNGPFKRMFDRWLKHGVISTDMLQKSGMPWYVIEEDDDPRMARVKMLLSYAATPILLYDMKDDPGISDEGPPFAEFAQTIPTPFIFDKESQEFKKVEIDGSTTDVSPEEVSDTLGLDQVGWEAPPGIVEAINIIPSSSRADYLIDLKNENFYGELKGFKRVVINFLPKVLREDYAFYSVGLYFLTLFAYGLDFQGSDLLDTDHAFHDAYLEFREEMSKSTANFWHPAKLNKSLFFEHQLASALATLDLETLKKAYAYGNMVIPNMDFYQSIDDFYKKSGQPQSRSYLPSPIYMLAYALAQKLRFIYAASISDEFYYNMLGIDEQGQTMLKSLEFSTPDHWVAEFYREQEDSGPGAAASASSGISSFNELWQHLKERMNFKPTDYITSFSGHGVVLVFDPEMVDAFEGDLKDDRLMHDLGFSLIDSLYARPFRPDFHPPYIMFK